MVNFHGTNLVTIGASALTTGQTTMNSSNDLQITSNTGPLTHGIFIVVKDSASYYIGLEGVSDTTGVKVSANNPIFIPISDPSILWCIANGDSKVLSWILY
jgi:hypothetical protein